MTPIAVCRRCLSTRMTILRHMRLVSPSLRYKSTAVQSQYILDKVRTYDYENYLVCLLSAKNFRQALFAIHAYNVELSLVLESASEQRASAGRFAFWTEALNGIYEGRRPYDHPVVQQLNSLYSQGLITSQQSKKSLYQMLTSRQTLSTVTHVETLSQLETYAEHTHSSVLHLALGICGQSTVDADHAASHLGRCGGLINALRATPYLASKNQLLLPQDILSKHKVSQNDVLRGRDVVKEPVFEVASVANTHFETAKALIAKLPKEASRCFLSSAIYSDQLELLRRCDFNIFNSSYHKKNRLLAWKLWRARRKL